ncbi:MAG: immune inhibitor A [Ignavibacteria bacterium]|nr:immune inhibitor A [Ignavibacteria bacterium]
MGRFNYMPDRIKRLEQKSDWIVQRCKLRSVFSGWGCISDLYIFENSPLYYRNQSARMGAAVKEMLVNIDSNVNYANYDKFDPQDIDSDGIRREPDGIVDFIFINFRFNNSRVIEFDSYTGYASLSGRSGYFANGQSEITLDGKRIMARTMGSGCIYEMNTPWDIGIPAHEFGEHYGYGADIAK